MGAPSSKTVPVRHVRGVRGLFAIALLTGGLGACSTPVEPRGGEDLRRAVIESLRRELGRARERPEIRTLEREDAVARLRIDPRFLPELEAMAGPGSYDEAGADPGPGLSAAAQRLARISLEHAVRTAVERNLEVQFTRLSPAIAGSQVVAAEAAFDWTFFSNAEYRDVDEVRVQQPSVFGFSPGSDQRQVGSLESGLRRRTATGGAFTVQNDLIYTNTHNAGSAPRPDPAKEAAFTIRYDQPLLRNFGSEVSQAEIRLERNTEQDRIAQLKDRLIDTVTNTETAYWRLYQAHRNLLVRQRLLDRGVRTRDDLQRRFETVGDVSEAQVADAVSRIEARRGDVLQARLALQVTSDALKVLMNDPQFPIGDDHTLLLPADAPIDEPIEFSFLGLVLSALVERPEVLQAIHSIDNTSIRLTVANNQRLPRLDLRLQARAAGLDDGFRGAFDQAREGEFISYVVGLQLEVPLGNRLAEAIYRRRNLERLQAVAAYENTLQQVQQELARALRTLETNFRLISQSHAARLAAANSLRAFAIEQEVRIGRTVESLNVEFQRQEALAQAELEEIAAMVNYNTAIADVYAAAGTALQRNGISFVVPDVGIIPPQGSAGRRPNPGR